MKKLSFFLLATLFLFSCVKQEFDAPPAEGNTSGLTANITIKDLKAFHKAGAFETIDKDWIIEGTVVADDQSGNYYKSIVIQDATAGIDVRLDATSLYNDYPAGRKINIKCKDLVISDYNGLTQLGGGVFKNASGQDQLGGIAQLLLPNYIVKGARDQPITAKELKISELTEAHLSTLVTLKNVQFDDKSMDLAYAASKVTTNRTVVDCDGIAITLRTSGYSTFANDKTPTGKGTITGIYSVFGSTKQFTIRDVSDVKLTETTRCNGTTGGGGTGGSITGTPITIGDLRGAFAAGNTTVAPSTKISGTVISDKTNKNITGASAVIQGNDGKGIIVRFTGTHPFNVGETIDVSTSGATLSEFNGALQVGVGAITNAAKTGTGTVTPKKVTLAQFEADFENMESTLVTIADATASTTAKFSGSINLTDASNGKAVMYTAATATFAADALPNNVVNVTGIVSQFNTTKQIQPRSAADVTKGTGGGGTGGGTASQKSIAEVRAVFTGTKTTCPATTFIKGIVISDKDTKNINAQNLILQEPNGKGILVRFSAAHSFALGDEIEVIVSGIELSEFNSLLQVNGVPLANGKKTGIGNVVAKELTISELNNNFENYESTLVTIKNATIPAAAKFGGAIKLNDGTGEIDLFTATAATFAASVPSVGTKTVTAIASQFKSATATTNGYQVQIRNESDIK